MQTRAVCRSESIRLSCDRRRKRPPPDPRARVVTAEHSSHSHRLLALSACGLHPAGDRAGSGPRRLAESTAVRCEGSQAREVLLSVVGAHGEEQLKSGRIQVLPCGRANDFQQDLAAASGVGLAKGTEYAGLAHGPGRPGLTSQFARRRGSCPVTAGRTPCLWRVWLPQERMRSGRLAVRRYDVEAAARDPR